MNQARTDKRKRLRETKRLGTVLTNGFVELAKLFGSVAPPDHPPELFGMMEAIAECLSFFPMIVAAAMTARDQKPERQARRDAVDVIDKLWQQVKSELLEASERT